MIGRRSFFSLMLALALAVFFINIAPTVVMLYSTRSHHDNGDGAGWTHATRSHPGQGNRHEASSLLSATGNQTDLLRATLPLSAAPNPLPTTPIPSTQLAPHHSPPAEENQSDTLQSTTENSDGAEKKTNGIEAEVGQKMIHENDTSTPRVFPTPNFHGCSDRRLCKFSNVCFSEKDGMLVFDVPGLNKTGNTAKQLFAEKGIFGHVTLPRRPVLVPKTEYSQLKKIYHVPQKMFVFNCWRHGISSTNPAHLLMGMGKLFVHSYHHNVSDAPFGAVLFHHCPSTAGWPWGNFVEKLIWDYAVNSGFLLRSSEKLLLPFKPKKLKVNGTIIFDVKNLDVDGTIICGKSVYQEPFSVARYLGNNEQDDVKAWHNMLQDLNFSSSTNNSLSGSAKLNGYDQKCARNLKVAAWNRTEGTRLRRITNMLDVENLVANYSNIPLSIVGSTSRTLPEDQIAVFQSFDILITTHGSQLANMIFGQPNTAYIEIVAVPNDQSFIDNGKAFAKEWVYSVGHLTVNEIDLMNKRELCISGSPKCTKSVKEEFKNSDLVVNIEILRKDFETALAGVCPKY